MSFVIEDSAFDPTTLLTNMIMRLSHPNPAPALGERHSVKQPVLPDVSRELTHRSK